MLLKWNYYYFVQVWSLLVVEVVLVVLLVLVELVDAKVELMSCVIDNKFLPQNAFHT
jgi:hypothetical protein